MSEHSPGWSQPPRHAAVAAALLSGVTYLTVDFGVVHIHHPLRYIYPDTLRRKRSKSLWEM